MAAPERDGKARGAVPQQRQRVFGQRELDGRGDGIDQPENRLSGLHAFEIIDVLALDDPGERGLQAGVLQQVEGVLVGRAGLRIARRGRFGLLPRHRLVLQQPLHALLLRAGLLEGRAGRRDLQLDVPGVEFGEQLPLLHARALRNGHVEDLPRHLEGEVHSVVGSSHAGEILVDKSRAGSRRHLHGAYHRRCGRLTGTRPGKQGDR